ncbi:MAG TPA: hypothetical protein VGM37_00550 [Armatimonadota bacterium]
MRLTTRILLAAMAVGPAACRAQQTQAVSRLVSVYANAPNATAAASRLVTVHLAPQEEGSSSESRLVSVHVAPQPDETAAASRLVTTHIWPYAPGTQASSRQISAWLGYSIADAADVLRIAAGLDSATARDKEIYNLVTTGSSAAVLDVADACRVAIYVIHPEWLP